MNCKFCQQECNRANLLSEETGFPSGPGFTCHNHVNHASVVYYLEAKWTDALVKPGDIFCTKFMVNHNNTNYDINWFIPNERYPDYNFRIDNDDISLVIFELDFWPNNVTPENIIDKMKIWLTLS